MYFCVQINGENYDYNLNKKNLEIVFKMILNSFIYIYKENDINFKD